MRKFVSEMSFIMGRYCRKSASPNKI